MVNDPRHNLIRILQSAHAGELAAAFAYRGHWKSVNNPRQKQEIRRIEEEEWEHRKCVLGWLAKLNAGPRPLREKIFWTIGRVLGVSCFISGWFFPMYFAGRLESQNVQEYVDAANYAEALDMPDCVNDMMEMSATEKRHEDFFKGIIQNHFLLPLTKKFFRWG